MNRIIEIVSPLPLAKDKDGFATEGDTLIASIHAYMENRHGSKGWANRAAFTTATALFRFRKIPNVDIDATHHIICNGMRCWRQTSPLPTAVISHMRTILAITTFAWTS